MISVVLTRRELVNSREMVYMGANKYNGLRDESESGCDHESAKLNITEAEPKGNIADLYGLSVIQNLIVPDGFVWLTIGSAMFPIQFAEETEIVKE